MAKARLEPEVKKVITEEKIILELSRKEAMILQLILENCNGDSDIHDALRGLGIEPDKHWNIPVIQKVDIEDNLREYYHNYKPTE